MTPWRLWLVILLAVLLPVRGAFAAAMMCPPTGQGPQQIEQAHHGAHAVASLQAAEHQHGLHPHHAAGEHDTHKAPTAPDGCNVCVAFCSLIPMASSLPTVAQPQLVSALSFPELLAPAPSFTSGGQDRPPRSI
jgi:hypothetical protein